jgi:hypothetical protein
VRSRLALPVVRLVALAAAGWLLGRVVAPVWQSARAAQPALRLDSSVAAAGQGVTLALLGGFRALVADAVWLRMYASWEKQDLPAADTLIRLVTAIDPRPVYFWLNGARIIAYDLTAWRIALAGGYDRVSGARQDEIGREQAALALQFLERAMAFHPQSADLWIERANIELNRLHDIGAAAASYRRAYEQPDAPYFAARLHGELLRRMNRQAEALAWLKQLHPTLPPGVEGARADLVLERIRDLERELAVPPEQAYRLPP